MANKIRIDVNSLKFEDNELGVERTLSELSKGSHSDHKARHQFGGGDEIDGWIVAGETWIYVSATTFTISGDKTAKYKVGDRIKLTQTSVKYFYIIGVSYSSPNTTITITGGDDYSLADATITDPFHSKVEYPKDFPHWFNWTPTITYAGGSTNPTSNTINEAKFKVNGTEAKLYLKSTIVRGSGDRISISYTFPITSAVPTEVAFYGIEAVVTTTKIARGCYTDGTTKVTIALSAAMANDGIISIAGFYRIA